MGIITRIRDAVSGRYTTKADAAARPRETVTESTERFRREVDADPSRGHYSVSRPTPDHYAAPRRATSGINPADQYVKPGLIAKGQKLSDAEQAFAIADAMNNVHRSKQFTGGATGLIGHSVAEAVVAMLTRHGYEIISNR